jgi:membrane-associated protease RseP (regulator of RpoE activity)
VITAPRLLLSLAACVALTPLVAGEAPLPQTGDGTPPTTSTRPDGPPKLGVFVDESGGQFAGGGLLVQVVLPGSSASALGLQPGDRIVRINGQPVTSSQRMRDIIDGMSNGQPVTVSFVRNNAERTATAPIQALPVNDPRAELSQLREATKRMENLRNQNNALRAALPATDPQQVPLSVAMQNLADSLNALPERIDGTAREFKRIYPNGRFQVQIVIDIATDASSTAPLDLSPQGPSRAGSATTTSATAADDK